MKSLVNGPLESMLLACLVARDAADLDEISVLYAKCNDKKLFDFAQEHECASIVAARLMALKKSSPKWEKALNDWKYCLNQRLRVLDELATLFKAEGIPLIALKNAGIARAIYPYPEECPMGDFDVLVTKADFARAHHLLLKAKYVLAFRVQNTIEEEGLEAGLLSGGTEYSYDLGDDVLWLELQWRSVAGRWISPELEPKAEDLFKTAIPVDGSDILIQDPVSNLLQVCLHTAKHSYVRAPGLRLHTDVDRIVRAYPELDWSSFVEKVEQMRVKTAVYYSLLIPAELLRTPIPSEVLEALRPLKVQDRLIRRALKKAGLFHPHAPKFSRLAYLAFTASLFDSPVACLHSAFPSPAYMQAHYGATSKLELPGLYAKRFANLIFRRVKT